ncbi:MAG TPA: hypothetical protein VF459_07530 [Caulobacteraceae bacterium]
MSAKPPFRADHVGSFLRPMALLDAAALQLAREGAQRRWGEIERWGEI